MPAEAMIQVDEPGRAPFELPIVAFQGAPSTLCKGCGHNSITAALTEACKAVGMNPYNTVKISGIGCSSKTPAYFLGYSHGFNSLHGRMPSVVTGATLANSRLSAIGVSGDGDTANIGLGQFKHACRRNVPVVYLVENNGCYGLTKGQFSATADLDSALRRPSGDRNEVPPLDLCVEAITSGATYVARSFAGDRKQLIPLLKGALRHRGTAVLDIVSPCVTFNDFEGSTKSWDWAKEHEERLHDVGFVPHLPEIEVEQQAGESTRVQLHDGSWITLRALSHVEHNVLDKSSAVNLLMKSQALGEFLTGLLYVAPDAPDFVARQKLVPEPLALLPDDRLRPGPEALAKVMDEY